MYDNLNFKEKIQVYIKNRDEILLKNILILIMFLIIALSITTF